MRINLLVVGIACAAICTSCGGESVVSPSRQTNPLSPPGRYIAGDIGRPSVPTIAADRETGAMLAVVAGDGTPGTAGAWLLTDGHATTVFVNGEGLPSRMVVDDVVFVFDNYRDGAVDIAAISGDSYHIVRRVPVPANRAAASLKLEFRQPSSLSLRGAAGISLKDAAAIASMAICSASIGTAGAAFVLSGGPALIPLIPTLAAACGSTLLAALVASNVVSGDLRAVLEAIDTAGAASGWLKCGVVSLIECVVSAVDAMAAAGKVLSASRVALDALKDLALPFSLTGRWQVGTSVWMLQLTQRGGVVSGSSTNITCLGTATGTVSLGSPNVTVRFTDACDGRPRAAYTFAGDWKGSEIVSGVFNPGGTDGALGFPPNTPAGFVRRGE